jgi:hypothetical protein
MHCKIPNKRAISPKKSVQTVLNWDEKPESRKLPKRDLSKPRKTPAKRPKPTDPGRRAVMYNWLQTHSANKIIIDSLKRDCQIEIDRRQLKQNLAKDHSAFDVETVDDLLQELVNFCGQYYICSVYNRFRVSHLPVLNLDPKNPLLPFK